MPDEEYELWCEEWSEQHRRCPCGRPIAECSDPERLWYPQRSVCRVAMERAAALRKYEQLHADRPFHDGTFTTWGKEATSATPYHYSDGVDIYVTAEDTNPDDEFLKPQNPFLHLNSGE